MTAGWRRWAIPAALVGGTLLVATVGLLLRHRDQAGVSRVALADRPKAVTVVHAELASYQPTHRFVGTLRPWVEAKVGPQFLSAYVSSVLVRPGSEVKRNQVLATLDCRDASARSHSVELQARALQQEQVALAAQAQRVTRLLDGGYVAANDVQQQTAQSDAQQAKTEAERARLVDSQLSVNDCILRAPFDGDVSERWLDPGAFVHPGEAIVSVVDRSVVRLVVDVPEDDFSAVAPGTAVELKLLAVKRELKAILSRRSASADPQTRTVHVEIDLPDADGALPVNTTAELRVGTSAPVPALRLPLIAADLTGEKAKLFVVESGLARAQTVPVLGEIGGDLFLPAAALTSGAEVVLEGRSALADGEPVEVHDLAPAPDPVPGAGPPGLPSPPGAETATGPAGRAASGDSAAAGHEVQR